MYQTSRHQKYKQSKQETVSSIYWQRDDFLPEKWHKTPSASGKMDQMTGNPTTGSPSISYASADHREDSVHQNSNQLSGCLKTLIMC